MTYGIEVRVDTNNMRTLRTIVERTRRDRVRSTDIIEQCGTQDIVKWERQPKRRWFNHVRQMDENRLPKIAPENPPGDLPGGHPKDGKVVGILPPWKRRRSNFRINRSTDLQEVEDDFNDKEIT